MSNTKLRIATETAEANSQNSRAQNILAEEETDSAEVNLSSPSNLSSALKVTTSDSTAELIDQKQFPLLHKCQINVHDEQVVETLLSELVRYKRKFINQTVAVQGVKMPKDALLVKHEFDNPAKHRLFLLFLPGLPSILPFLLPRALSVLWIGQSAMHQMKPKVKLVRK